jgi:hypothetical protein
LGNNAGAGWSISIQVISDLKLPLVESSKCRIQSCHFQFINWYKYIANWKTPGDGGYYDDMITKLKSAVQFVRKPWSYLNIRGFYGFKESDANNNKMLMLIKLIYLV